MRTTLIQHMHRLRGAIQHLPAPFDSRGFFTAAQMSEIIGRPPRWTDGTALHLLDWTRTVRRVHGITKRVWFPPGAERRHVNKLTPPIRAPRHHVDNMEVPMKPDP